MFSFRHLSRQGVAVHRALLGSLAVSAALVLSTTSAASSGSGASLRTLVEGMATVLLLATAAGLVRSGKLWRQFRRHDSIRADIAAAGGLGKRLLV